MLPDGSELADWVSVYHAPTRRPCEEQALVLKAMDIPHHVTGQPDGWHVVVLAAHVTRARRELGLYRNENPRRLVTPWPEIPPSRGVPLAAAWTVVLCLCWVIQSRNLSGVDWLAAGELVAGQVREGEWWRTLTALTLHGDSAHAVGNIAFGAFFGYLAGQYLGSGVAALATLALAGLANGGNALVQLATHRSIGASTAVFTALGLVVALAWAASRRHALGWARVWSPLVAGIALLAFIGTGDEQTDIFAHLAGFLAGLAGGAGLNRLGGVRPSHVRLQALAGAGAAALLALAWWRVL
jgi:membrane associated rhomboid family serine protease